MFSEHATAGTNHQPATPELRLTLLGTFGVVYNNQAVHFPRRKVAALLAFLVLYRRAHTRDMLATLFWGDSPDEKARHSLRTALATLRSHISDDLLLADRDQVQLNPSFPVWSDLQEWLSLEKAGDLALPNPAQLGAWLEHWQIDLLPGFDDEWVLDAREHYRTRLLALLLQLVQRLRTQSEYAQAIAVARKVLSFDAANEQAHQHLMFCFMASGDRAGALRQYEFCEEAMERDLDASPLPETTALYHWIKRSSGEQSSSAARITNLPIPLTSFVGRTAETAEIKGLLAPFSRPDLSDGRTQQPTRLLTLIGTGGSGKTRLAIQCATDVIDRFADGVWWVELATLTDAQLVVEAVAKAVGVAEVPGKPHIESLNAALRDKQILLVLDNCEHLINAAAQLVDRLLSQCVHLRILTTSREALNLIGERLWHVPPLSLPDPQQLTVVDLLMKYECIRLFVERATAIYPDFRLTPENSQFVVEICRQLDGIPLAIELAASRVKVLSVEEIAGRLKSAIGARFALLTQGSRTAQPRQQTLRAAIDWSYDLLDEDERRLFRQLALFRGGFTLEAAEQVAADSSIRNPQSAIRNTLDLLTQLVDKSLVIVEPEDNQPRYRMLETLREYALEQFVDVAEVQQVQKRHANYYLQVAEQAKLHWRDSQQAIWLNRLDSEHPNLRLALETLTADKPTSSITGEGALRLTVALFFFWDARGFLSEGRQWLRKALTKRQDATPELQAKVLNQAGFLAFRQSDFKEARLNLAEAVSLFEQAGLRFDMADSLQSLAAVDVMEKEYDIAQQRLQQSLDICYSLQNQAGIGRALMFLGNLATEVGKWIEAREYHQQSLKVHQEIDDLSSIAACYSNLGKVERFLGNLRIAHIHHQTSLQMSRSLGHKVMCFDSLQGLGEVTFEQQNYAESQSHYQAALTLARELGDRNSIDACLSALRTIEQKLN